MKHSEAEKARYDLARRMVDRFSDEEIREMLIEDYAEDYRKEYDHFEEDQALLERERKEAES